MKRIFTSFAYSGVEEEARIFGLYICTILKDKGFIPLCPQIYYPQFMSNDDEYELALSMCLSDLRSSDHAIYFLEHTNSDYSNGMRIEYDVTIKEVIPYSVMYRNRNIPVQIDIWIEKHFVSLPKMGE